MRKKICICSGISFCVKCIHRFYFHHLLKKTSSILVQAYQVRVEGYVFFWVLGKLCVYAYIYIYVYTPIYVLAKQHFGSCCQQPTAILVLQREIFNTQLFHFCLYFLKWHCPSFIVLFWRDVWLSKEALDVFTFKANKCLKTKILKTWLITI